MNLYSDISEKMDSVKKYNVTYSSYDELHREEQFYKYHFIFVEKGFEAGETVLDLGCGTGLLIEFLKMNNLDRFSRYICLDPSENMLKTMLSKPILDHRIIVINGYGENLPLRNSSVDTIYSFTVWNNVLDKERFLYEALRVLKPGGYIILSVLGKVGDLEPTSIWSGFKPLGCRIDCFYAWFKLNP